MGDERLSSPVSLLTGSFYEFLFSVPRHMERFSQMESGFIELQVMHTGPSVQNVALSLAVGVKTWEDVLAEACREGGPCVT